MIPCVGHHSVLLALFCEITLMNLALWALFYKQSDWTSCPEHFSFLDRRKEQYGNIARKHVGSKEWRFLRYRI